MAATTFLASSFSPKPEAGFSSQSIFLSSIAPNRKRFPRRGKRLFCTFGNTNSSPELEKPYIELEFIGPKVGADGSYPVDRAGAISGEKLLRNIMLDNKIELYAAYGKFMNCGGGGSCGTCIVEIIDGKDLLNGRTDTEKRYLKKKPESWRLACQTIVGNKENSGKVIVQRLPQWKKVSSKLHYNFGIMWKQFLGKLHRKSSKSESATDSFLFSNSNGGGAIFANTIQSSSSGNLSSSKSAAAVKRMPSSVFPSSVVAGIEPLISFKDVSNTDKPNLFINKLSICCTIFDFSDPNKNSAEKDIKRQTLLDLVDYVHSNPPRFTESMIEANYKMFASNLFRVFPPNYRSNRGGGENEEEEPMFDPAWSHLQIVYELLLQFIASPSLDPKVAKKYVDHYFILRLLDLFDSEDPRERECLKTILHRVYGKFMVHRPFIRQAVSNIFFRFIFETERHNGIAELLEVFGSVISGFALPLKEEHKIFLSRALIPLHKPKTVGIYMQQLTYCVTQFIEKEPKLASTVIVALLKYWPMTNSQKEVMFLSELEEILELTNGVDLQKCLVPLFRRIAYCLNSSHFQVAERALFLWNNDHIMAMVAQNRHVIMPLIIPALEKNASSHWNQAVLNLTMNIKKMFSEMDEELVLSCQKKLEEEKKKLPVMEERKKMKWEQLEKIASSFPPLTVKTAVLVSPTSAS